MATRNVDPSCYELSSDEVGGLIILRLCDPCIRDNNPSNASLFCTVCKEKLCSYCKNLHLKYTSGNHAIISIEEAESRPPEVDMKGMDRCQEHGKMIKFICEDHSLLCCSECMFIHRNCKHVYKVKDTCQLHKEKYRSVKESLEKSYSIVHDVIEDCKGATAFINKNESEVAKEIHTRIDNMIVLLNDTRSKVLKEAHAKCETETQRLHAKRSTCESVAETIAEILPLYSSVLNFGTPEQALILTKMFEEKVAHVQLEVAKQDKQPDSVWLNVDFAPELSALLKKGCGMIGLGQ